jgi:hypothetical protein
MEEPENHSNEITMILYKIDNDKKTPSQNWEIIPKKKYTIGRSKNDVDLSVNLKLLSRKHAELIYYDSKTIMVKDLDSRNGTFINKIKIEPLKETFFSNRDILSFGNLNNEIVFFNPSTQPNEDLPQTLSDNLAENGSEKSEKDDKIEIKKDINKDNGKKYNNDIIEEINTDIIKDTKNEKRLESMNKSRQERESESRRIRNEDRSTNNERERNEVRKSYVRDEKDDIYFNDSKEPSKKSINKFKSRSIQGDMEKNYEKNKERSISNRDTINNRRDESYGRRNGREYYENNNNINDIGNKNSRPNENKYKSTSKDRKNYSRSRSHSRSNSKETLIQEYHHSPKKEQRYPPEMPPKTRDYYSYDIEREKEKEKDFDRREYYGRSKRTRFERERNDRRRNEYENDYYRQRKTNDRRYDYDRKDNLFEEGNRIILNPEKMNIYMNPNIDSGRNALNRDKDKNDDIGYIKCYVEGYMYLKIKKSEINK